MVAGGVRIGWHDVPEAVRAAVEDQLGSPVIAATSQPGGFSPGSADRVRLADGRTAFVKAVGTTLNSFSPGANRREFHALPYLPGAVPVPRLPANSEDGDWVAHDV